MKTKKTITVLIFLVVLFAMSSLAGYTQSLAGCCCDFTDGTAQSDSFLEYTDCLPENYFVIPRLIDNIMNRTCNEICALRAEEHDGEEPGPGPGGRCGDAGYKPGPKNLRATNIKGEKQIRLIWEAECPVDYFKVLRCQGTDCSNFVLVTDKVTTTYFVDTSSNLLWDEDYTYRIIAHYNLQGDSEPANTIINTGDIECLKRFSSEKFCISSIYYNDFADYLKNYGYGFTPPGDFITNFTGSVQDQFFDKFNKAFLCGDDNKLGGADDVCARKGIIGICIVDEGVPDCIVPTDCESISGGTFGLYYDLAACEGTAADKKFCYLDKSKSIVDKCYSCSMSMSCYDYRSQRACEKDNCGVGECVWKDVYPDIGIGVCVDERFSSCYLCNAIPTGPSSESYNAVFEQCSEAKSDALATAEHPCYWKGWKSLSCDEVTCRTYKSPSECGSPSGGIQLYPNNTIKAGSVDSCDIGVCQWRPNPLNPEQGDCLKNADGDSGLWPDCSAAKDEEACELDYIPPDTTIVASGALGVYDKLNINIFDKISRTDPGEYKTGSKALGYTTYFCHYPEGQAECDVHNNPLSTRVSSLMLSYLTLHNTEVIEGQEKLADLAVGFNYIKYYSVDPSKNPGPVKEVRVYACARCVGPQIIDYSIENAITIGNRHYTNNLRPVLKASFDIDAEITTAEIDTVQGTFISPLSYKADNGKNYTFVTESALDEGEYVFRINARDDEGTYMNEEFVLPFTVDLTAGKVNFTVDGMPAEGVLINKTKANLGIALEEQVSEIKIFMNGREITGAFAQQQNRIFTAQNVELDEGTLVLSITAKDLAGNTINADTTFFVNGRPPVIKLRYPSFGVSPNFKFNITVETLNRVSCRFLYDVKIPDNVSFDDLERFDSTDSNYHIINEFTRIPDGDYSEHTFHVFCNDPLWGRANASFKISVDTTNPAITAAYADPAIIKEAIAENKYRTYLKVSTNEPTLCKYSDTTQAYSSMEYEFPGYIATPHIPWPNSREIPKKSHIKEINVTNPNKTYEYYVACEDLAGRVTETATIEFHIDLSIPFDVFGRTPPYANSSSVLLSVETNKRAFCFYGRDNTSITSAFQNDGEYAHTTDLVNLPQGANTFYVRCQTRYLAQEVSRILPVTFIVDVTPPEMVFVNDSSNLVDEPDTSYFPKTLRASWLGRDNETNVTRYYYRIETFYGGTEVRNWSISTISNQWVMVNGLNLTEQTTYKFLVKPENAAGLIGEIMGSDGVLFDPTKMPPMCNNSELDTGETDIDCGGTCLPCTEGKSCLINADCLSMYCKNGTCAAAACDDLIHNGDESDVDCGGTCKPCAIGYLCRENSDCETGNCQSGICGEPDPCFNQILDGIETDVDCGGACKKCEDGNSCLVSADCYSGLCTDNVCTPKKREGESCINDTECESGLVCKDEICQVRKAQEGEFCQSTDKCEEGLVCYQSRCALDSDGDGMPDEWEMLYGFDPNNPDDALADPDGDGLSNADEFRAGTNPSIKDTDGDKWGDGQETRFGTDPLDTGSRPSSFLGLFYHPLGYWWLWLLILLIGSAIAMLSFYGYKAYTEFKKEKEKERKGAETAPSKKEEKPSELRELTEEEKKLLAKEAEEEKEIEEKLEKVREIIEKKVIPGKEVTPKEWVDIRKVAFPPGEKKPAELKPVFRDLELLKEGKLGKRGRKKALEELEKLLGKREKEKLEEERKKEGIAGKKKPRANVFERLKKIIESTEREKERELKALEKMPFGKLKMMALASLPPEERRKVLEKFILLKTGKLTADEKRELFEKLREIAEYYEKHKKQIEGKPKKRHKKQHKKKTLKKAAKKKKTIKKKGAKK
ncbi:hypothetical protein JW707_05160 [Candidatus Woesearchaeota archaeon]|nr:hypothetical protein [Candidatus Woesearchaeota archaeon]